MLHKCNRAWRENVACDILSCIIGNFVEFPIAQATSVLIIQQYTYGGIMEIRQIQELLYQGKTEEAYPIIQQVGDWIFQGMEEAWIRGFAEAFQKQDHLRVADYLEEKQQGMLDVKKEVPTWKMEGYTYQLAPKFSTDAYVNAVLAQLPEFTEFVNVFMFGYGDGSVIEQLLSKMPQNGVLLVVDPDEEIKEKNEIEDKRLLVHPWDAEIMTDMVDSILNFGAVSQNLFLYLTPYHILFENEVRTFIDIIEQEKETVQVYRNTQVRFKEQLGENILSNMTAFLHASDVGTLVDTIKQEDVSDIPAIIVGAGPSLPKNVEVLKEAEGKAFIICTDSAIRTLLNHGVTYDIAITLDPVKPLFLFEHPDTEKYPLLMKFYGQKEIPKNFHGKLIFSVDIAENFVRGVAKTSWEHSDPVLQTGGSVACDAYSLALQLGFRTIFFVGMDLAFTGGEYHAKGAFDNGKGMADPSSTAPQLFPVKGMDGRELQSDWQMTRYRKWFEREIALHEEYSFVDATEGGALIEGTEILPLHEAIEKYGKRVWNAKEVMQNLPPAFSEEKLREFQEGLPGVRQEIQEFQGLLDQYEKAYRDMILYLDKKKPGISVEKTMATIQEAGALQANNPTFSMIEPFTHVVEQSMENILNDESISMQAALKSCIQILEHYREISTRISEETKKWSQ